MEENVYLLGIDPGTDFIGFSLLEIDPISLEIKKALAWSEQISRYIDEQSMIVEVTSAKFARLKALSKRLKSLFVRFNPIAVACEAPFYNRLKPSAYAPLVETVFTIQSTLHKWDNYKPLYMLDPPTVKVSVGAKSRADKSKGENNKDIVKTAIKAIVELSGIDFDQLDSHAIDACAVAYCHLKKLREMKA